ncbi:RNA polymerase sigma factor [Rathayibacter sp. SD072]|uniref:RNA polymerase sigma factor n=1 Tax=Rathayibacter sp. SD072 TaxID=2781731 RepID=UPI001A972242|nr:RNA polymerase sigma factor [Rathayibacter sp. SD072]MBO0982688.1 RNA polymerase sigma factor [Rathayibacter sp. SD072]
MSDQESDAALWLAASSGTERAFVRIFDRYRVQVFRAALRRTGTVGDAEEVVAIVFMEAWRLRKKVRIVDGSLLPWLLSVTSYVTLNHTRAQRRYARLLAELPPAPHQDDHAPSVDAVLDGESRTKVIAQAVRSLSAGDRAVVELCLIDELPMADAAAALNLPVGTVKSRLNRARRQLRTKLADLDITIEAVSPSSFKEGRTT